MRRNAVGAVMALTIAGSIVSGAARQTPQFRAGVHTVSVFATVLDANGRLAPDLAEADFEVFDDGVRQPITLFENAVQPITVVMMIDRSVSVQRGFDLARMGAEHFVGSMLAADRARVGSFNGRISIEPAIFTSDHDELVRILHLGLLDAGVTPLWNATSAAVNALAGEQGRRVVMLFSDGYDNPAMPGRQTMSFYEVHGRLQTEGIMVYAIGLTSACGPAPAAPSRGEAWRNEEAPAADRGILEQKVLNPPKPQPPIPGMPPMNPPTPPPPASGLDPPGSQPVGPGISVPIDRLFGRGLGEALCPGNVPNPELRELASESGGGYFELHAGDDLNATFARLADELHHQYLLGFTVTKLDGRTHKLEVRVRDSKMTVRARKTYVAK